MSLVDEPSQAVCSDESLHTSQSNGPIRSEHLYQGDKDILMFMRIGICSVHLRPFSTLSAGAINLTSIILVSGFPFPNLSSRGH